MSRKIADVTDGAYPCNNTPAYRSTEKRAPREPLIRVAHGTAELSGPRFGVDALKRFCADRDADLSVHNGGQAQGQRIIVYGRVCDDRGRPERNALVEIWQANAAGRYQHKGDQHDAPIDRHFFGAGACVTDNNGCYRFLSIEPGAYPWGNHANAWRPKHIHFSLFGSCWGTRLVTQMYFPGDPLLEFDPIYQAVPAGVRERLVSSFELAQTEADFAMAFRFDIVLRGTDATPLDTDASR